MSIDRTRLSRLANRKAAKEAEKPIPAICGDCEYSFEHLHGYNSYVCDIDAEPIQLNKERADCPRRIPMQESA
jgi:hypothetical protein